jgi:GntR family histidine utilization transcriptional repressor
MTDPIHRRITADLAREIASGAWPPGKRLPIEQELMVQYGCARATVGKALDALVAQGLVERRRKAGTFVAAPNVSSAAVLQIPDIRAEIEVRGQAYRWHRLSLKVRRAWPEEAKLAPAGGVLEITGIHFAAARPFAYEERLINLEEAPLAADEEFKDDGPGAWLLAHAPWTEARHEISAINPDPEALEALSISRWHACLLLKRRTWRQGVGITYARQIFPGELFELTARFTPVGH